MPYDFPMQQSPAAPSQQYSTVASGQARAALPRVRMQMSDAAETPKPRLAPLEMPSPEQLGLGVKSKRTEVNWDDVRLRLQRLKVTSFHLQKLPDGYRFICALPGGPGREVHAEAATEAEAIDRALAQAEAGK
jgi:hypothetical protein